MDKKVLITLIVCIALVLAGVAIFYASSFIAAPQSGGAGKPALETSNADATGTPAKATATTSASTAPADETPTETPGQATDNPAPDENTEVKYTFEQAGAIALQAAKKQFGENGQVNPVGDFDASPVTIDGKQRMVYYFAAMGMGATNDGQGSVGLYHVDANTGEVFDNSSGEMKKIQ